MKILSFKIKNPLGTYVSSIAKKIKKFFRKVRILIKGNYFITNNNRAIGTKILYFSILWFLLTGLARIMAGGHFLSDVAWSGYISYLIAWITYRYYYLPKLTITDNNK